ncbi:MAG TPA: DUF1800 family protein, partial [Candidatus Binatia bacterium]|jgi:uncharacterized protein (DUF1800 family)|nr:DUF1800 family protein [Candidatus Binatia bacterium]
MRVRVNGGFEDYHDKGSKTLLNGFELPGGQSQTQELNAAIDNIAFHSNVAPFIGKQLIQHLVTSNPSPAYVARISAVFMATANSPIQLYEVVRAILLDTEARGDFIDPTLQPNYGKLREPVQFITNLLRAFNATGDGVLNSLNVSGSAIGSADMGQDVFNAPSVFSFYPPTARGARRKRARPAVRDLLITHFTKARELRQQSNFFNYSRHCPESPHRDLHRYFLLGSSREQS